MGTQRVGGCRPRGLAIGIDLPIHGRLHHAGIGRTHVRLLITDLHVRVVDATTGKLRVDASRDDPPGTTTAGPTSWVRLSAMS